MYRSLVRDSELLPSQNYCYKWRQCSEASLEMPTYSSKPCIYDEAIGESTLAVMSTRPSLWPGFPIGYFMRSHNIWPEAQLLPIFRLLVFDASLPLLTTPTLTRFPSLPHSVSLTPSVNTPHALTQSPPTT